MSDSIKFLPDDVTTEEVLDAVDHPAWDQPVICRVEVDLPGWLAKLTGEQHWEVYSEDEEENCISFAMRAHPLTTKGHASMSKQSQKQAQKQAEVTLYHNGYAVVDVDGESLFNGALTATSNDCARLSYYHVTGEPIALN